MLRVHGGRKNCHHEIFGINRRVDAIQASVLNVKVKYLPQWLEARRRIADRYIHMLRDIPGITTPTVLDGMFDVYHQYTLRVRARDDVQKELAASGIGTTVCYSFCLHLQPVFADGGYMEGGIPESEGASAEAPSLPMFPELTVEEQDYAIGCGRAIEWRLASPAYSGTDDLC